MKILEQFYKGIDGGASDEQFDKFYNELLTGKQLETDTIKFAGREWVRTLG